MSKQNYTKEQIDRADRFAKIITDCPKDEQKILLVAADAFMAGLSARNTAQERTPELMTREA